MPQCDLVDSNCLVASFENTQNVRVTQEAGGGSWNFEWEERAYHFWITGLVRNHSRKPLGCCHFNTKEVCEVVKNQGAKLRPSRFKPRFTCNSDIYHKS